MKHPGDLNGLIPLIYETVAQPDAWAEILEAIRVHSGATATMLGVVPAEEMWRGQLWTANLDAQSVADFMSPGGVDDSAFAQGLVFMKTGRLVDFRTVGEDVLRDDPGAQRLLLPHALTHGRFGPVLREGAMVSGFAIVNEGRMGPVSSETIARIEALLPHVERSLAVARRFGQLSRENEAMRSAFDNISVGVLLLSGDLRVRFANSEAERILADGDGIRQREGRIWFLKASVEGLVMDMIGRLARPVPDAGPPCLFIERPSGLPAYTIMAAPAFVSPLPAIGAPARCLAALLITDPSGPASFPVPELLCARFGLTATESEIARLVATGRGVAYAAQEMQVSLNTARTHLKAVYSKMGVNNQTAMTRLILASFPGMVRFDHW